MTHKRWIAAACAIFAGLLPASAQDDPPAFPTAEFAQGKRTAAITAQGIAVEIRMERRPEIDTTADTPVLHVLVAGKEVLAAPGVASGMDHPSAEASIAEIDPANTKREVYFSSYSGGAHCCSTVIVATETPKGWVAVKIGEFDGDGRYLADLDKDGVAEIAAGDNRFLYQFGCYACSAAPLRIQAVKAGVVSEVSTEPRYRDAHRKWLAEMEENTAPEDRWTSAGFLAGWIGQQIRLGRGEEAWKQLLSRWNLAKDEGSEVCITGGDVDACRRADKKVLKFPDRLKLFLDRNGYRF